MRCTCGESFDSHRLEESLIHVHPQPMKFVEPSHFTDPDAAARKLVEIKRGRGGARRPDLH
jgi:hypothetical protein